MSIINILPPGLQNQIAAGEVVERPASVVKELMENSLDAGARSIQVYLESGGQSLIRVVDDGSGLLPDDLPLALTRHATSKISNLEELSRVSSFGFRGEALPSIASISQLTICSRPVDAGEGFYYKLLYGESIDRGPLGMNPGTAVSVENLLANVPARLKFLKTRATESRKCMTSFIRHCLACLSVDFELFSESRSIYRFFPHETLSERLCAVWPAQICDSLRPFELSAKDISVHGLASAPESTQPRPDRILLYVNRRPVNDRMLLSAVRQAYKGSLLSREYPQAVVFINLPAPEVDVNVHPAKNEVRFRNEKDVFSVVSRAVKSCLDKSLFQVSYSQIKVQDNHGSVLENPSSYHSQKQENIFTRLKKKQQPPEIEPPDDNHLHHPGPGSRDIKARTLNGLCYLGQVAGAYLLFLRPDSTLLIVDQHAAHERIMLEKIKAGFRKTIIKRLVVPQEIAVHPQEIEILQGLWKELREMGFILTLSSENRIVLSGTPDFMSTAEAVASIKDILSLKKQDLEEIFIAMACRTAIKAGTELTADEAAGLMDKLLNCLNNQFCPHGRPVYREIRRKELEKMFKRT